jgi:hypothetical protein
LPQTSKIPKLDVGGLLTFGLNCSLLEQTMKKLLFLIPVAIMMSYSAAVFADGDDRYSYSQPRCDYDQQGNTYYPQPQGQYYYPQPQTNYYNAQPQPSYYPTQSQNSGYYDQRSSQGLLGGVLGSVLGYELGNGTPIAAGLGAAAGSYMGNGY